MSEDLVSGNESRVPVGLFTIQPDEALRRILKVSASTNNLIKGIRQCLKAIDRGQAYLCVITKQSGMDDYNATIQALCREKSVNIVTVPTPQKLAVFSGLCKLDSEGEPIKPPKCGCVVIKSRNVLPDEEVHALEEFINKNLIK